METPLFLGFLAIHIVSLIVGMGAVIVIDVFGLLWIFKKVELVFVAKVANTTQKLIWIGWVGLVLSGVGLIFIKGYVDNLTFIKLFFVALVGFNGVLLHFVKKSIESVVGEDVPTKLKFNIAFTSTISQIGWWGAITIGFLHRHWKHYIDWPQNPEVYIGTIIMVIIIVSLIGKMVFNRKQDN